MSSPAISRTTERIQDLTLGSPITRAGYEYWQRLCRARQMPAWSDMAPREFSALTRHVCFVAVIPQRQDYLFTLVGDEIATSRGVALMHRYLSEVSTELGDVAEGLKQALDDVCHTRSPYACQSWLNVASTGQRLRHRETVFLPLGKTDESVDQVFVVDAPFVQPG